MRLERSRSVHERLNKKRYAIPSTLLLHCVHSIPLSQYFIFVCVGLWHVVVVVAVGGWWCIQSGTLITFAASGAIATTKPIARSVGTTISIRDLFHTLPVRHKQFVKTVKNEYTKMLSLVQSYALV